MSSQAPSPAASAGGGGGGGSSPPVTNPSPPALSPSNSGSKPGASSPPPVSQPSPSPPPPAASTPPVSTPPASSPPPTSSPPATSRSPPPSTLPPTVSPPPASSPPPKTAPPAQSPPPPPPPKAAPPAQSPLPKAAPPAQPPPPPDASAPSPVASFPPIATPAKPSSPPAAAPPPKATSSPPSSVASSPPSRTPSPKGSPPSPKAPAPTITGGSPPPPGKITSGPPSVAPSIRSPPGNTSNATTPSPTSSSSTRSGGSSPESSKSDSSGGGGLSGVAIGGIAVVGLIVLAVIGILIWCAKKKRRRDDYSVGHYGQPPAGSFSVKSDGPYIPNSSGPYQYPGQTPSPNRGHGYVNGYQGPNGSSGEVAFGVPSQPKANPGLGNSKSWFTYEELAFATDGFSTENLIGEGGFGCVYKGYLPDGQVVAVKQLKVGSGQGEREFQAEVEIISRVHHRHLVSLVGYCIAESQRLLVYDYVPNGTLEHHLHGRGRPVMDWATRLRIAVGAARGLAYLHEDCHPRIIHRDIKSSNILLDDKFEAQVSDFGLAKLALDNNTHVTTRVMGTFGYMAPEYASSGKLTERSDVFSFGVVLLELVTGRKPVDPSQPLGDESLVEWARPSLARALEEGNFEALADPKLENNFDVNEMFRMVEAAAACVRHSAYRRPRMAQVVRALESDSAISDLNNGVKPGQSTLYNSAQYSADIRRFRRMAFGSQEYGSDYSGFTTEHDFNPSASSSEFHNSKEREVKPMRYGKTELETQSASSSDYPSSGESETCALNRSSIYRDETRRKISNEVPTTFRGDPVTGR